MRPGIVTVAKLSDRKSNAASAAITASWTVTMHGVSSAKFLPLSLNRTRNWAWVPPLISVPVIAA